MSAEAQPLPGASSGSFVDETLDIHGNAAAWTAGNGEGPLGGVAGSNANATTAENLLQGMQGAATTADNGAGATNGLPIAAPAEQVVVSTEVASPPQSPVLKYSTKTLASNGKAPADKADMITWEDYEVISKNHFNARNAFNELIHEQNQFTTDMKKCNAEKRRWEAEGKAIDDRSRAAQKRCVDIMGEIAVSRQHMTAAKDLLVQTDKAIDDLGAAGASRR